MLNNHELTAFVDRVARDSELQADLAKDFDGTIAKEGLRVGPRDKDALRAAWQYLRELTADSRQGTVMAGWGIGC